MTDATGGNDTVDDTGFQTDLVVFYYPSSKPAMRPENRDRSRKPARALYRPVVTFSYDFSG
ncbi:hypothetical protein [Nocardia araoensis]|uniref:hypothetical protein n=1 Tax=Nocardia araoensis TaxID=228600 RepID=UPI0002F86C0B|nr:hypothetical protein [Nocardia araoensis]